MLYLHTFCFGHPFFSQTLPSIFLRDHPYKDGNAQFTSVPLKPATTTEKFVGFRIMKNYLTQKNDNIFHIIDQIKVLRFLLWIWHVCLVITLTFFLTENTINYLQPWSPGIYILPVLVLQGEPPRYRQQRQDRQAHEV